MVTFDDVKKAVQDVVDSESGYEKAVSDDDAAHAALLAATTTANQTAAAKSGAQADLSAKLDALDQVIKSYESQVSPAPAPAQ